MTQSNKAPEVWIVASVDPKGALFAYENEGHFYLTPDRAAATPMNLLQAEKVQKELNVEFKKSATSYDRFGMFTLKPVDK